MDLNEFIANFIGELDFADSSKINADTKFHELDEWDSISALMEIGMIKSSYGKTISNEELKGCETIKDLFDLVNRK